MEVMVDHWDLLSGGARGMVLRGLPDILKLTIGNRQVGCMWAIRGMIRFPIWGLGAALGVPSVVASIRWPSVHFGHSYSTESRFEGPDKLVVVP
jgi:hypothetical protein